MTPSVPASGRERARHGDSERHQRQQVAESFGSDPQRYDRARPRYPLAMVERIVAASPGTDVLDVGVGTGIVAQQVQANGYRVLGVDVDARMAELARRRGIDVELAAFEAWDRAGRSARGCTASRQKPAAVRVWPAQRALLLGT
jgi:2-polyprenyl-3-methyl-5-hydroxy-6-metoxy-1,4-benzoquinol methylase